MNIFAIGDLHLPGNQDKPMDIFGPGWINHAEKIATAWRERVRSDDWVLVPGDLSWALKLHEARDDLAFLGALPGKKILIRGNHDYWWQAIGKVRSALPPSVQALQNDFVPLDEQWAVCGTRGWDLPGNDTFTDQDERIYLREIKRLELSLQSACQARYRPLIAMLHYPPGFAYLRSTPFTRLLEQFDVKLCVYGHLHGEGHQKALTGESGGVRYELVSCDAIGFAPRPVASLRDGQFVLASSSGTALS